MKAISIKQPWASLICTPREDNPKLGIKDIENRTWKTKLRGRVYVHASAKITKGKYSEFLPKEYWNSLSIEEQNKLMNFSEIVSTIIGEVDIIDCVINHSSIWAEKTFMYEYDEKIGEKPIGKPIWNWVLANPVLYDKPILNVKGKLSFWDFNKQE